VNKRNAKIPASGIAIVSMLQGYSRQRRTIGSFSETAELLVFYSEIKVARVRLEI